MKRTDQSVIIFRLPAEVKKQLQLKAMQNNSSLQEIFENFTNQYLKEDK